MKMTLSNGAFGGSPNPNPRASYSAKPGRNGLYGKKPLANVNMAIGMNRLAIVSNTVDVDGAIVGMIWSTAVSFDHGIEKSAMGILSAVSTLAHGLVHGGFRVRLSGL